ncbi:MAG: TetR family transcriptional regulator [Flavobacteriales bacterium]|nr:TetR family transcriptional regulator [Flavobacteriales bacterium]
MPRPSRRDHLVETATLLFNQHGFHATGIERILTEGRLAKMTLYRHFPSKDALILGVLQEREQAVNNWFAETLNRPGQKPVDRLLSLFTALEQWIEGTSPLGAFRGCLFVKAAGEFPDLADPIHEQAAIAKQGLTDLVQAVAVEAGFKKPKLLARQLMLLKDGAIVSAQIQGSAKPAKDARKAAEQLIGNWPKKSKASS